MSELKAFDVGLGQYSEDGSPCVVAFDADENPRLLNEKIYLKSEKGYLNRFSAFFWACDCEAKMRASVARAIWHYIQHATEDFRFGYSGRPDCATFQQFKQGIKDCVDEGKGFRWW